MQRRRRKRVLWITNLSSRDEHSRRETSTSQLSRTVRIPSIDLFSRCDTLRSDPWFQLTALPSCDLRPLCEQELYEGLLSSSFSMRFYSCVFVSILILCKTLLQYEPIARITVSYTLDIKSMVTKVIHWQNSTRRKVQRKRHWWIHYDISYNETLTSDPKIRTKQNVRIVE